MPNPYESPKVRSGGVDPLLKTVRRVRIAMFCTALSGLLWIVVVTLLTINLDITKQNQSAFDKLTPIFIAFYSLLALSLLASTWGLATKKHWSINSGIYSLAFSGFSILIPVTCIGIWALMDKRIKHHFKPKRNAG